ncbi:hypothetical protein EVAR_62965_1 [Eumeta japonica]|uniref:Uncharacterized protein n=1 Tax=Eumeta variegata TaxID=151549 RepID=A0A4C1ZFR0_EUMVA|nr:hypothetical protein EVAR_62965_1 [Eumeta japonica]
MRRHRSILDSKTELERDSVEVVKLFTTAEAARVTRLDSDQNSLADSFPVEDRTPAFSDRKSTRRRSPTPFIGRRSNSFIEMPPTQLKAAHGCVLGGHNECVGAGAHCPTDPRA